MQRLQVTVMDPIGVVEGAFHEIKHEYQLGVKVCYFLLILDMSTAVLDHECGFFSLGIVLEYSFKFDTSFNDITSSLTSVYVSLKFTLLLGSVC